MAKATNVTLTEETFRRVLSHFATGVTVITVEDMNGSVHGMTANSFTSVSLNPLLVLVCVDHKAKTRELMHLKKRFGVNVLEEGQEDWSRFFTQLEQDASEAARLGIGLRCTERGTPMLERALAHLDCKLVEAHVAGDHTIFIGEVEHAEMHKGNPLLFFRGKYHRLPDY
jgi:flavin reductase (DIM6/NTAB) family NADH-FMN oxidoreductase RutF